MNKKVRLVSMILLAALIAAGSIFIWWRNTGRRSESRAAARAQEFAQAVNYEYEHPERIYPYLTESLREQMTEAEFTGAFLKERSYPYLSPLFLNFQSMEMAEDNRTGTAVFSQAARLPGMIYKVPVVFENGDYYMDTFREFADGSYLEKFRVLEEQSDWVDGIFSKENSLKD